MWCTTKALPKILKFGSSTLEESPEMSITVSTNSPDGTSRSAPLSRFLKNGGSFGNSTFSKPFTLEGREIDIEIVDDNDLETDAVVCEIEEYDEDYEEGGSPYQLGQDDYIYKNGNSQVGDLLKKYGTEMKRPNGMMIYRCEVCTKTFDHKRYLTSHMVSHTTNAHFVCNICSRGFKRKQELRRHYDGIHAKVRPFKCKLCFSEFQLRYGLTRHLQSGCPKAKKRKGDASPPLAPAPPPVPQVKTIVAKPSLPPPPIVPVVPQSFNLLSLIQRAANSKVVTTTPNVQAVNIAGTKIGAANPGNFDMMPKTLAVDNGQGSVLLINLVPVPGGPPAQSSAAAITTTTASVITTTSSIAMKTDVSSKPVVKTITSMPALKPATVAAIIKSAPAIKREPASSVTVKQELAPSVIVKQRPTSVIVKREMEEENPADVDVNYESYVTCVACCQNFLSKEKLALHERVCKNQLNKAQVLQKFYKSQTKREDLTCDLCTRTFRDEQYFQMHYSTCPGYKSKIQGQPASEFQCDICLKCFTRKSDLKRHGLVHTKARPFVCSICGQSFQFNYVLYRHYLFCHPDEAAQQTDDEYLQEQVSAAATASSMGIDTDSN